ncbi:metallophosphoesterase [Sphingomonas aurantiaca]
MSKRASLRWLHFSDIHVGMSGLARLWPRSSTVLLDNLETAHKKTDGFDLIIFSGDLAQTGSAAEFEQFDLILDAILGRLGELGAVPPVVTVPGNHDLFRPDGLAPAAMALAQFWSKPDLRNGMWDADKPYVKFLEEVFANYTTWLDRAINRGVHLKPVSRGLLPGDASYILDTLEGRAGIIGLNSTWLQLGGGNYEGDLHVDTRQLLEITGSDPDVWVRSNDLNLLVTHQPAKWLRRDSPASWENDINPSGRFDAHLFGHMHEPDTVSMSRGGGLARRDIQAASLFGLEVYGDGHNRIQGYSANRIDVEGVDRALTSWPRRLVKVSDGRMKLVPDNTQDIDEEKGSFTIPYQVERRQEKYVARDIDADSKVVKPVISTLVLADFNLNVIRHTIPDSKAHAKVRRVEQEQCVEALKSGCAAWLISDWGMGRDGFIAAVSARMAIPRDRFFIIDFNRFSDGESFFDELRTRLGATFQEICEAVAETGPCVLVLDDVDLSGPSATTAAEIEALVRPVCDFASEASILIRARRKPKAVDFPIIELKALDEPDVAIYARESELGGERYAKPDAVSTLLRHTDGVPSRIDDALRDLEIISIGDLITANPDYGDAASLPTTTPAALISSVSDLATSQDVAEERAYNLLLALSTLPQGEQLPRLTRFLGSHPFYPSHARALVERSLIDTVNITTLEGMPGDSTHKALVVPRPVREYVRSIMDDSTARAFDRKALILYFGEEWSTGQIQNSPTGRRARNALCDGYEIQNATALILRAMRRALLDGSDFDAQAAIRLASGFIVVLAYGDHFRAAAALSEDMIRLLEPSGNYERAINNLRFELARSYRMMSRLPEARTEFERLDHSMLSKSQRQLASLGFALVLKGLGDHQGALDAADRVIAIDKRSSAALHAKSIIADRIQDPDEKLVELRSLLASARKAKSGVVTNNILITIARLEKDDAAAVALLDEVVKSPSGLENYYNSARGIIDLATRTSGTVGLSDVNRARLVDAYHFLYSERISGMFDRCHAALWNEFERNGEIGNLLNLFRHSSFIWRIGGRGDQERKYLNKLAKMARELLIKDAFRSTRDGAYFVVRVSVVMTDLDSDGLK